MRFNVKSISALNNYLEEFGIELDDKQLEAFNRYYELLIEWNNRINLTAITEFDEVLKKHFLDSLSIVKAKDEKLISDIISGREATLIDIGCGAGFPSVPLKIAFPNLKVTMLDSLNKRINFLNEVIEQLGLKNIEAIHGRAEDYAGKGKLRENYDIVVSRAVANLSTLSEYCLPYVKVNGIFVAYKAEVLKSELDTGLYSLETLGGKISNIYNFILPYTEYNRNLCIVNKVKPTPAKYPRKAGMPSKEPLGTANC